MHAKQTPQPRQAPPDGRAPSHLPLSDHFLRLLHSFSSAWQALHTWLWASSVVPQWLPGRWRHPLTGYLLALFIDVVAASVTLLLVTLVPAFEMEGVLLLVGIVLVALTCGVGPSLLATSVGLLLLEGIVLPPSLTFRQPLTDWLDLVVLLVSGIGLSLLAGQNGWARRKAEALAGSLSAAQTRSDEERQRLRTVLEVLPVGVFLADATGRLLETNPACRAIWGETAPLVEASSQYGAYQGWWPGTDQRLAAEDWALARALHKGEATLQEEIDIQTFDGQRKTILNFAVPFRDATDAITGGVVAILDISERKRLEAALRQAEQEAAAHARELEAIFEALPDGLLVYDAEGRILRHNTAARQLLGFEVQPEFAALPWQERAIRYAARDAQGQSVPPEDLAVSRLLRGEVLTSAETAEDRLQTLDGRDLSFSMTGRPLRDAEGTISGAVGVVRDVTERRRLEREVAEHAAQLEAIFESIADGVVVTDRQGRVLHMNRAFRTLLGLEQEPKGWTFPQMEGLAGFAGYTAAGQPLTEGEAPILRVLQGEVLTNEQSLDTLLRTCAGRETRLNTTGAPIRDATGQIIGSVLVARDVTEQRRLEQQTRAALEALLAMAEALVQGHAAAEQGVQARDQTLRPGADPALTGVAARLAELTRRVLDCQSVSITAIDPATEVLTPITVVGLTPADEQRWWTRWEGQPSLGQNLPASAVATLQAGEPVLLGTLPVPLLWWQQLPPLCPSALVPMHVGEALVGLLHVDGGVQGDEHSTANRQALIRATARLGALVLERERLLREHTEARASELALRETQAHMETFLGMAGHELKNPLAVLTLSLQVTERRLERLAGHDPAAASDLFAAHLTQARQQVRRLERLVNDLLDVARVRAGKLELHLAAADLAAIVREAVEEQRQAHPARTLLLDVQPESALPVRADADRIGQVVTNYLTNALKYSPADGPVEVGLDLEEGQARVWVRDQGPGLPPDEQERIWERFHRVKGIEVQSGTGVGLGLGLHICRTIIQRHQGQVGVESAPGQGSTFWFTLPLGGEPEERAPKPR